jgi:adenosylcobinamide-GDP ribazoletransferase
MTTGPGMAATRSALWLSAEIRAASAFLTRLPISGGTADPDRTGAAAFAVVGAMIGLVGAIPLIVLGPRLPLPAAGMALIVIVVVTGGLHLDGLGDTADALAAPTPDAAERARIDPRAGAAGVVAIVLDLLLGASLLAAITAADPRLAAAALVVAGSGSRAVAPIAAWTVRIRRPVRQVGLGGWFASRVETTDIVAAIVTTIVVTVFATVVAGVNAVWVGAAAGLLVAAVSSAGIVARRGQLDGDGYGAIVEVTFIWIIGGIALQVSIS